MANNTVFANISSNNGGFFAFAFTGGLWLYYATGQISRRDPSSASSYPASQRE